MVKITVNCYNTKKRHSRNNTSAIPAGLRELDPLTAEQFHRDDGLERSLYYLRRSSVPHRTPETLHHPACNQQSGHGVLIQKKPMKSSPLSCRLCTSPCPWPGQGERPGEPGPRRPGEPAPGSPPRGRRAETRPRRCARSPGQRSPAHFDLQPLNNAQQPVPGKYGFLYHFKPLQT